MNLQKVLLGALLIKPELAPYALPNLEIEHFPADLQPVFAAISGLWNARGRLDAVEACTRYPEQQAVIMECVGECESECIWKLKTVNSISPSWKKPLSLPLSIAPPSKR